MKTTCGVRAMHCEICSCYDKCWKEGTERYVYDDKYLDEMSRRFPLDAAQQEYKDAKTKDDDMPFVLVNGEKKYYDNGNEYVAAINAAEDAAYLEWLKNK